MTAKVQIFGTKILWNDKILSCDTDDNLTCYTCTNSMNTSWEHKCSYIWGVSSSKFNYGYTAVASDDKDGFSITYISNKGEYIKRIKLIEYGENSEHPMEGGIVGGCLARHAVNTMYFAMFGGYPSGGGSGLVKVKDALTDKQTIDWFPLVFYDSNNIIQEPNIHNCYQFHLNGKWLTFAAVIGAFFTKGARGFGLMHFNTSTKEWQANPYQTCLDLSVRSAKQLNWNGKHENKSIVLTQNYAYSTEDIKHVEKTKTQVCILNWKYPELARQGTENSEPWWELETSLLFETPIGSEGGADVILGGHPNTFWISLRAGLDSTSSLIFLRYKNKKLRVERTINLGTQQPRYMTFIKNDLYICNEADKSLQIIKDLKHNPKRQNLHIITIPSSQLQDVGNLMYIQNVM